MNSWATWQSQPKSTSDEGEKYSGRETDMTFKLKQRQKQMDLVEGKNNFTVLHKSSCHVKNSNFQSGSSTFEIFSAEW